MGNPGVGGGYRMQFYHNGPGRALFRNIGDLHAGESQSIRAVYGGRVMVETHGDGFHEKKAK
tara:strand:- start:18980 stop:19165 length:186 start_codon:yes stop_codon:yes gene_type:complete